MAEQFLDRTDVVAILEKVGGEDVTRSEWQVAGLWIPAANTARLGLAVVTLGIAVGLAGAMVLTRFLAALLFEVSPTDRAILALAAVLLLMVAVVASSASRP